MTNYTTSHWESEIDTLGVVNAAMATQINTIANTKIIRLAQISQVEGSSNKFQGSLIYDT